MPPGIWGSMLALLGKGVGSRLHRAATNSGVQVFCLEEEKEEPGHLSQISGLSIWGPEVTHRCLPGRPSAWSKHVGVQSSVHGPVHCLLLHCCL